MYALIVHGCASFSVKEIRLCWCSTFMFSLVWGLARYDRSLLFSELLTSPPVIQPPDWNLPFEIMCDASDFAVGAVCFRPKDRQGVPCFLLRLKHFLSEIGEITPTSKSPFWPLPSLGDSTFVVLVWLVLHPIQAKFGAYTWKGLSLLCRLWSNQWPPCSPWAPEPTCPLRELLCWNDHRKSILIP